MIKAVGIGLAILLVARCEKFQIENTSPYKVLKFDPSTTVDSNPTDRIIAFGDSLAQGSTYFFQYFYSFAYYVADRQNLRLVNAAVSASRIADDAQLGRILRMKYRPADQVIWLSGYNDMRYSGLLGASEYRGYLERALDHLSPNVKSVYLGTCLKMPVYNVPRNSKYSNGSDAAAEEFRRIQIEVASKYSNVFAVDTTNGVKLRPEHYIDKVHPSMDGLRMIGDKFFQEMRD